LRPGQGPLSALIWKFVGGGRGREIRNLRLERQKGRHLRVTDEARGKNLPVEEA